MVEDEPSDIFASGDGVLVSTIGLVNAPKDQNCDLRYAENFATELEEPVRPHSPFVTSGVGTRLDELLELRFDILKKPSSVNARGMVMRESGVRELVEVVVVACIVICRHRE